MSYFLRENSFEWIFLQRPRKLQSVIENGVIHLHNPRRAVRHSREIYSFAQIIYDQTAGRIIFHVARQRLRFPRAAFIGASASGERDIFSRPYIDIISKSQSPSLESRKKSPRKYWNRVSRANSLVADWETSRFEQLTLVITAPSTERQGWATRDSRVLVCVRICRCTHVISVTRQCRDETAAFIPGRVYTRARARIMARATRRNFDTQL